MRIAFKIKEELIVAEVNGVYISNEKGARYLYAKVNVDTIHAAVRFDISGDVSNIKHNLLNNGSCDLSEYSVETYIDHENRYQKEV